ncbi:helix-turn-helix domain-containing protein [Dactylosporangium cerinum]
MEGLDVMASGDTPAVARRTVRLAIKDARTAKGLTQTQVAEAMEWSLSKVMRIESGEVTISQNDLRPLLTYLSVREKARVDELIQAAKASKQRRQWWDERRFASLVTTAMKQWFSYEFEATSIRIFCASYLPAFLQTPAFARSLLEFFEDELSKEEITARIETRTRRRQAIDQRKVKPQIFMLLDESVLYRGHGHPDVLRQQLSAALEVIREGWVTARIAPYEVVNPGIGHWEILYLGQEDLEHAVLYRENATRDEIIDDPASLTRHLKQWNKIWQAAHDEEKSVELIERRIGELVEKSARTKSTP